MRERNLSRAVGLVAGWLLAAGTAVGLAACGNDDALITLPDGEDEPSTLVVYVSNYGDDTLSSFSLDVASQEVTEAAPPVDTDRQPLGIAVTPSVTYLYSANEVGETISGFEIDPATGELSELAASPWATGADPTRIVMDPARDAFTLTAPTDGEVHQWTIDPANGDIVDADSEAVGSGALGAAVHPTGDYLYAGSTSGPVFEIDIPGGYNQIAGTPHGGGGDIFDTAIHPSGDYLYVSDDGSGEILMFDIDGGDGTLSNHSPPSEASGGSALQGLVVDPSGSFVYVTHNSDDIGAFEVLGDGTLSPIAGMPFLKGLGGFDIAVDPTGQLLFVPNEDDDTLGIYEIDSDSGALTEIAASPVDTGTLPRGVAVIGLSE